MISLEELKRELIALGNKLEDKQDEVIDIFERTELPTYFRCRDNAWTLAAALYELEQALYRHKVLL